MLFQCWSRAVGGGPILKQHWVKSSRLLGSTQVSVYTHPSPTIIFSPADQGTLSKTASKSQAYYNTWNWERGTYDVNHLHILTCEVAVSRVGSVGRIMSYVTWSCEKIQKLFICRAICDNTAHVQWTRCSPKGSHLIHWTSAVFSHIALKWTTFACHLSLFIWCCYPKTMWCRNATWQFKGGIL